MINRLKKYLLQNHLGKQFPLDYRIYMIFFFESYVLSILSAITNTALGKGLPGLILQWGYIAFSTAVLFAAPRVRLALQKPHLLFVTFFYIPFLYFQTAGYNGTALLFAQLGLFLLCIVFTGKWRLIILALNLLDYLACILISHYYPQLVIPHQSPHALLIDLIVAAILSFAGLSLMTIYISKIFADNNDTLAELSIRDALTGAYNRRFLDAFLRRELENADRTGSRICVLMLDIDHFKRINDRYGHGFGDHVLLACVQAIRGALRKHDVIARYGGEEFAVILLPHAPDLPFDIAERIRKAVSSLRFRYDIQVTVSIGIGQSQPRDTAESLLMRADRRMYQAKQAGRNRVVSGSGSDAS